MFMISNILKYFNKGPSLYFAENKVIPTFNDPYTIDIESTNYTSNESNDFTKYSISNLPFLKLDSHALVQTYKCRLLQYVALLQCSTVTICQRSAGTYYNQPYYVCIIIVQKINLSFWDMHHCPRNPCAF